MTNISNNNDSNHYIYILIYISQVAFITDHNHISIPISLSYYLFKDILNLYTYFTYSFVYTYSYIHSRILIHVYSFTYTRSCILIHIFLSLVIIFWLYVIIIIYHLTTLCFHDILSFMFTFMFQFIFIFIFHVIFMFHEHIYTFFIFYIFLVSCLLHMAPHILVKYDVYEITPHSYILIPL